MSNTFKKLSKKLLESKNVQLFSRKNELNQIERTLKLKQYVFVHGLSGNGKSTLACQYAHNESIKDEYLTVKWIDASFFGNVLVGLKSLIEELEYRRILPEEPEGSVDIFFSMVDKIVVDNVKLKLNSQYKDYPFLFVLDNVVNKEDIKELTYGLHPNIKVIITSTDKVINEDLKFDEVHIDMLTKSESMEFIGKQYFIRNRFEQHDWSELLDCFNSEKISPLKLSLLFTRIKKNEHWQKSHVVNYIFDNYEIIEFESYEAHLILPYLAYFDCNKIVRCILQDLYFDLTCGYLDDGLKYLKENLIIRKSHTGYFVMNKLLQQEIAERNDEKQKCELITKVVESTNK